MAIVASDLVMYGSASRPSDDTSTVGGAIDATNQPIGSGQLSSAQSLEILSDGADTRTVTVVYRDSGGVLQTSAAVALNGTTPVSMGITATAVLSATLSTTSASRTVTLRIASAGATVCTITPNETTRSVLFIASTSESSTAIRYEKVFLRNNHATLSLLSAQVTLTADPSSRFRIGLATSVNDTAVATNRKTAPGGISFVDDNIAQSIPGTNLAAAARIGVWVEQNLPANDPAARTTFTLQLAGQTAP